MIADRYLDRKYTVDEIREILEPVFRKNGIKRAILFGSYSRGDASAKSDIDILVDSQLHGLAFYGLLEDVVNSLHKDVDLIDTRQIISNSRLQAEIDKYGVVIYAA